MLLSLSLSWSPSSDHSLEGRLVVQVERATHTHANIHTRAPFARALLHFSLVDRYRNRRYAPLGRSSLATNYYESLLLRARGRRCGSGHARYSSCCWRSRLLRRIARFLGSLSSAPGRDARLWCCTRTLVSRCVPWRREISSSHVREIFDTEPSSPSSKLTIVQ